MRLARSTTDACDQRMLLWRSGADVVEITNVGVAGLDSTRVLLRITQRQGRWVITDLLMSGEQVDAGTLRALPLSRIEAALNSPGALADPIADGSADPSEKLSAFLTAVLPVAGLGEHRQVRAPRAPLSRPDGSDPDTFYGRVAEAYAAAVVETSAPAKAIALEAGVPVPTAHRWIFEARRRGFLCPARKGRAG